MSNQPPTHSMSTMSTDLIKRILLSGISRPVFGEGANFCAAPEGVFASSNATPEKILKAPVREDALLSAVAYGQLIDAGRLQHFETEASAAGSAAFEQDSNIGDYSMDDLSPQGLNGSGDDPMLTIGMDQDSSGTNEHSNSDPIQSSEVCFSMAQMSQDKVHKKKGRPAKGSTASTHGRFGVRCPVCNKPFNNSSALAKHKLTHSDERKYVCNTCSKTFKRQDHLNGHMLTHSSKKPFECKYKDCGKSYCDARSLKRHLEHHHAMDGSFSSSNQPGLSSYEPSSSQQQINSQSTPLTGNYPEQFSPVSSTSGSSNGASDKIHNIWPTTNFSVLDEPLPHKCDLCNRCFKNLPALNGHMRLHGGYFKKEGASEESVAWSSDGTKRKAALPPSSTTNLAILSGQKTGTPKFPDASMGITQSESLPVNQIQTGRSVGHRRFPMNIDSAESSIPSNVAISGDERSVVMTTSTTADTIQVPDLGQNVQLVSIPPIAFNLSVEEFLKLQDKRMAYLPSEPVAAIMVDSKGIALSKDALAQNSFAAGAVPQFYHAAPGPMPMPSLTADMMALQSKPYLAHVWKNLDENQTYVPRSSTVEEPSAWKPGKELVTKASLKETERELSEHDETSTDSAKDTDQEDTLPSTTRDIGLLHKRRRWASADPDQFTCKVKGAGQSPNRSGIPMSEQRCRQLWKNGVNRPYDPDSDEALADDPPIIDDVRNLKAIDDAQTEGEFRNPNVTPALLKFCRKHRPEPLIIPPQTSGFAFHSRLRSPRLAGISIDTKPTMMPYTPPPMLSPIRSGPGLFCQLSSQSPVSAPVALLRLSHTPRRNSRSSVFPPFPTPEAIKEEEEEEEEEEEQHVVEDEEEVVELEPEPSIIDHPPETDISPHVNVGPDYQAEIPTFNPNRHDALSCTDKEVLVWDPSIMLNMKESEVRAFMDFACSAAVPFNGSNKEYAHHILSICGGNFKRAVLKLMQQTPRLAPGHTLHSYIYQEADIWSTKEIETFQDGLTKFDKDFFRVSQHVSTKSVQKCVQFYYMWKKVATDEHKRLRIIRRKREQENLYNLRSSKASEAKPYADKDLKGFPSEGLQLPFSAYDVSDGSVGAEQEDHVIAEADLPFSSFNDVACDLQYEETVETEEYPCKICGKVFGKVKSRSAHMKTHRPIGNVPQSVDKSRPTYSPQESWHFNPS